MQTTTPENSGNLPENIAFIAYLDRLKNVIRANGLYDGSRDENTAEHSWHAALSALILLTYADEQVDVDRVIQMLLVHDLIEIESGDTFVYDASAMEMQQEKEAEAADIVFSRLAPPLGDQLRVLWEEFEARITPEAKFAKAIDRFLPIYSNICNGGFSWLTHGITLAQVQKNIAIIREGSAKLADIVDRMAADAAQEGYLIY
jgi:putative hydrolases of HD superfamily